MNLLVNLIKFLFFKNRLQIGEYNNSNKHFTVEKDYLISYNLTFVCLYKCVCLLFLNFDIVFRIETPTLQHLWSPLYILNIIIIYQTSTPIRTLLQKKKPLISYNKTLHGSVAMDLFNTPPQKKTPLFESNKPSLCV